MLHANEELQSPLARVWSAASGNAEYFSSSPEVQPRKPKQEDDLLKYASTFGVPLVGMVKEPGKSTAASLTQEESEGGLSDEESDAEERRALFLARQHYPRRDTDIIKQAALEARLNREFLSTASGQDANEEVETRKLPRTDSKSQSVGGVLRRKRSWRKPRLPFIRRRSQRKPVSDTEADGKVVELSEVESITHGESEVETEDESRALPRTDSLRHSVGAALISSNEENTPRQRKRRSKWFGRKKSFKVDKLQVEAEKEPLLSDAEELNEKEKEVSLNTDAEDSEVAKSEDEVESEAELTQLSRRESGKARLQSFLAQEQVKQSLQQPVESEEEEEVEVENKYQRFIRTHSEVDTAAEEEEEEEEVETENKYQRFIRAQSEVQTEDEETVDPEAAPRTRYQQFIRINPPREEELDELAANKEVALLEQKTKHKEKRRSATRISNKRKSKPRENIPSVPKHAREVKPRAAAKRNSRPKSTTKSKRHSVNKSNLKPLGTQEEEEIVVKPSNVALINSPGLIVQAWLNAFVALLLTFFTYLRGMVLGNPSPVNNTRRSSKRHSRSRNSSKRRSLKQAA